MPFVCCKCPPGKNQHARGISYFRDGSFVEYCRVHDPANRRALFAARNVFEGFTLEHVRDEQGKKVKVNSVKELREAEKRYNFSLAIMSEDDISKPPVHEPWAGKIDHGQERVWNRDPAHYAGNDAIKVADVGMAKTPDDTLANRQNPI